MRKDWISPGYPILFYFWIETLSYNNSIRSSSTQFSTEKSNFKCSFYVIFTNMFVTLLLFYNVYVNMGLNCEKFLVKIDMMVFYIKNVFIICNINARDYFE